MDKSVSRRHAYTYLTDAEYDALDIAVQTLGFHNRAEFQTAAALTVLSGENVGEWCVKLNQRLTTHNLVQQTLNTILDNTYLAVLAMKGFSALLDPGIRDDIRRELFDATGYVPSDEELNEMIQKYHNLRKDTLFEHRRAVFASKYGNANEPLDMEEN